MKCLVLTHFRRKPPGLLGRIAREVSARYRGEVIIGEDLTVGEP